MVVDFTLKPDVSAIQENGNQPEGPAELLVVHGGLVLALPPFLSYELRLVELELALLPDPGDAVSGVFVRQQLQEELPQLDLTVVACAKCNYKSNRAGNVYKKLGEDSML